MSDLESGASMAMPIGGGGPEHVLSMRSMAVYAYQKMVDEAFDLQQRIVLNQLLRIEFGDDALPAREFLRRSLHRQDVLAREKETHVQMAQDDSDRLRKLLVDIRALEELFRKQHDADNEAFTAGLTEYIRRKYGDKRK